MNEFMRLRVQHSPLKWLCLQLYLHTLQ